MRTNALVTLAVGDKFNAEFRQWFLPGWREYCERNELDLIVIDRPLDTSERAGRRNPSWQKCLTPAHPVVAQYEQVAWVDADIRIRPDAPNIFDGVPVEKIAAVDEYATPSKEEFSRALDSLYADWDANGVRYVSNRTPQEFHANFGLDCDFERVLQGGVFVFSPAFHADVLSRVYDGYEDKGDASWNFEMRPLSYEVQTAELEHWLTPKFNMTWGLFTQIYYPFLNERPSKMERMLGSVVRFGQANQRATCVNSAFHANYFLHFSGRSKDYRLLDPQIGTDRPVRKFVAPQRRAA